MNKVLWANTQMQGRHLFQKSFLYQLRQDQFALTLVINLLSRSVWKKDEEYQP